jgi:orotate phosphoribosyltransferase
MSADLTAAFLELVTARRGHFRLESGHHGELWLDLDSLFAEPRRIDPFVDALASALAGYRAQVICGPLLGGAFLAQLVARSLGVEFCFTERAMTGDQHGLWRASYRLPPAFHARVRGWRVAIVDDVMSAGSALRGSDAALREHGAQPVVAAALLVLGTTGAHHFEERGVPVEAVAREQYALWLPASCPLCATGVPLEDLATP